MRAVFRRLDPQVWKQSNHNPVVLLGRVSQETLERAAADPRYLALYRRACETYDSYLASGTSPAAAGMLVAYFSMEYGLLDCMPIYSGGLGVLSGDHLKSSSDAALPLVGIGLLYQRGYLQQYLDAGGWQQERTPVNDFYSLPLTPVEASGKELLVSVNLAGALVYIKVWRIDVGRVKLYLLDTNIPQNPNPAHRDITGQLYGGDLHNRMRQEIVLGIGGLRALKALGLEPTVFHMNEGHSAFLAIERIGVLMRECNLTFEEALEATRNNNVFTTHTPVPAGIDLFDLGLLREYFGEYCQEANIPFESLAALGKLDQADPQQPFSMAVAAFRCSAYRNAVSRLHRKVSQQMWEGLWPGLPLEEIPITSITNGVHLPSWLSGDMASLYDQYLQPDWRETYSDKTTWQHIADIPDAELWEARRRRKRRLIAFIRERAAASARERKASSGEIKQMENLLDPDALTIGFARRFVTYKRATLLFRDLPRLIRILANPDRPVQLVISGKAHPLDVPGKTLIQEIVRNSRMPELARRLVFIEDYGMQVAREMVGGVDVWLNTPRRGEEASGTSGMKAGMNGVLNLSVLDGWFDEVGELSGGWIVGGREPYSPDRDEAHASAIYSLLENEIVPLFYGGREQGVPVEWMRRVKQSLRYISAEYNCQRMLHQYVRQLYEPARASFAAVRASGFEAARSRVRWNSRIASLWPRVTFLDSGALADGSVRSGAPLPIRARLDLAGLKPEDVRVEAVIGRIGPDGELVDTEVLKLTPREEQGNIFLFEREFTPVTTGRLGLTFRVSPNHFENPLTRPCNSLITWAGPGSD
jgi:starch phosphorylase